MFLILKFLEFLLRLFQYPMIRLSAQLLLYGIQHVLIFYSLQVLNVRSEQDRF